MKYILAMLLFVQALQIHAQNNNEFTLKGKITDSNNESIPFVNVKIDALRLSTITDMEGNYQFTAIPVGVYQITVSMVGFQKQTKSVSIANEALTTVDFTLQDDVKILDVVTIKVETKKEQLEKSAEAVQVIETKEVKLQSADMGEVMAKSEGVSVQRAGGLGSSTRFALNGLSGDKVRFFYNGIPLNFTPYAFGIANVPVNAFSRVEVYKGVVPIQFGADALGGAVNLVSPTVYSGWSGSASYQTGSFNTHRAAGNIAYANDSSGWFGTAGAFYDYTQNNYKIDVAIANEKGKLQQETIERFHDDYSAVGTHIRLGIRNKKWANELSFEGYYGSYNNQIQNSQSPGLIDYPELGINKAVAGNPFGDLVFTSISQGLNLRYNVNLTDKWIFDLKAGYNYNENISVDTSHNLYNWYGDVVRVQNEAGEFGEDDHLITKSKNYFVRQQLRYLIADNHTLNLSIAPTSTFRTADDLLIDGEFDPALDKGYLFNFVTGLEYKGKLLKEKLQTMGFVKNYQQNIRIESVDPSLEGLQVAERSVNNFGAGAGLRYAWTSRFATKLSYEYAYRLPRQNEIFGNGQLIGGNLELKPENSHNVNVQWSLDSKTSAKVNWKLHGNYFHRKVNDLIFLVTNADGFGTYDNVWSASSQGIELGGQVRDLVKGLSLKANTTYQSYYNTSDEGPFASYKGDRIPRTPYFFANGSATYQLEDVIQKNDRLSFFYNTRYVHPYFIGWESAGLPQFKAETPRQLIHAVGVTQKMKFKKTRHALTLQLQNLTNAKVFDMYGVQRPGRAFYIKLTTQF